jgi:hypothetical protein
MLTVALLLWAMLLLIRRLNNEKLTALAQLGALLALVLPLNLLRTELGLRLDASATTAAKAATVLLAVLAATALIVGLIRRRSLVLGLPSAVSLFLVPLIPIQIGTVIWQRYKAPPVADYRNLPSAGPLNAAAGNPRILWMIFDAMDYEIAFRRRPPALQLPEFDKLRAQSLQALEAYPPAMNTKESMPSLITGRLVEENEMVSPNRSMLKVHDRASKVSWSDLPNLFSEIRRAGHNSSLTGYYVPYCRIIGDDLSSCFWRENSWINPARIVSGWDGAGAYLASRAVKLPLGARVATRLGRSARVFIGGVETDQRTVRELAIEDYLAIRERAHAAVNDLRFRLVLVHWPVPHFYNIYDRRRETLSAEGSASYLDNLALADRSLGEIRKQLEQQDLWDRTTVIVSSDHPLRMKFWEGDPEITFTEQHFRVPFLLKLAGQRKGLVFHEPFNTILTHDLILELLAGAVETSAQAEEWLRANRERFPTGPPPSKAEDDESDSL